MELTERFKKESEDKYASVVYSDTDGNTHYSDEYVEWLEDLVKKLTIEKNATKQDCVHWGYCKIRLKNKLYICKPDCNSRYNKSDRTKSNERRGCANDGTKTVKPFLSVGD